MNNFIADGGDGYTVVPSVHRSRSAARSTSTRSRGTSRRSSPLAPPALNRITKVG